MSNSQERERSSVVYGKDTNLWLSVVKIESVQ